MRLLRTIIMTYVLLATLVQGASGFVSGMDTSAARNIGNTAGISSRLGALSNASLYIQTVDVGFSRFFVETPIRGVATAFKGIEWKADSVFARSEFQYRQITFRFTRLQDDKKKSHSFFENEVNDLRYTLKSLLPAFQITERTHSIPPAGKDVSGKISNPTRAPALITAGGLVAA
jgi:hypothetical protein